MGKVRRLRKKYHLSKVESGKSTEKKVREPEAVFKSTSQSQGYMLGPNENIFAGLDIPIDQLIKNVPRDFDVRSIVSTKSRKELKLEEQHLKKKEKRKLKHERFLKKLEVTRQTITDAKGKKKKKKPANKTEGDNLNYTLNDGLPFLKSLPLNTLKTGGQALKLKSKGVIKLHKRIQQQTRDAKLMRKIISKGEFISNPQKVTEYLRLKVALER